MNTGDLLQRLRRHARPHSLPIVCELVSAAAAVDGFDYYLLPSVLNTADTRWISGYHRRAFAHFGDAIPWSRVACEGYLILNPDCAAARLTAADPLLTLEDALACVQLADKLWRLPILYVEYSGVFGNLEWLRAISQTVSQSQIFYGGGIRTREQAQQASVFADTIVVGNVLYEDFDRALTTVAAHL